MNVMAEAHKAVKAKIARLILNGVKPAAYKVLFAIALRGAHKEYKAMVKPAQEQNAALIAHCEDIIAKTLVHFEKLGVNDYYIAIENNANTQDYTLLQHKDVNDKRSALGWASYSTAIIASPRQADEYVKAYPGVVKLHAETHLSRTLDHFRDMLAKARK